MLLYYFSSYWKIMLKTACDNNMHKKRETLVLLWTLRITQGISIRFFFQYPYAWLCYVKFKIITKLPPTYFCKNCVSWTISVCFVNKVVWRVTPDQLFIDCVAFKSGWLVYNIYIKCLYTVTCERNLINRIMCPVCDKNKVVL